MAQSLCQPTYWPAIDLVPAGAILSEAEESLSRRAASGEAETTLYFEELRSFLAALGDRYDIAVVDTRPDVNMLMTAALHAATGVVVPTRATMTDLASTGEFFAHLAGYVADFNAAFGQGDQGSTSTSPASWSPPTTRPTAARKPSSPCCANASATRCCPASSCIPASWAPPASARRRSTNMSPRPTAPPTTASSASANAVNRAIEREILRAWGR